jgi:hypothetical protein
MLPSTVITAVIFMAITTSRAKMIKRVRSVKHFGGVNPGAWLIPWVVDSVLGVLASIMVALAATQMGIVMRGMLIAYNSIGAFDYAEGAVTQMLHPQEDGEFPVAAINGSIGGCGILQLITIGLPFSTSTIGHFTD